MLLKKIEVLESEVAEARGQKAPAEKMINELCEKMNEVLSLNDKYNARIEKLEHEKQKEIKGLLEKIQQLEEAEQRARSETRDSKGEEQTKETLALRLERGHLEAKISEQGARI